MRPSHKYLEMALFKLSAIASDIIGRVNGSVFQRTKSGLIMRSQPGVIRSSVAGQYRTRTQAAQIQAAWQSLSVAERQQWDVYAVFKNKSTRKNPLTKLSGQQIFQQENSVRLIHAAQLGTFATSILTVPILTAPPSAVQVTGVSTDGVTLYVGTDYDIDDASEFLVWYFSRPLLPSQVSEYNKKKIAAYNSSSGVTQTLGSIYTSLWGVLPTVGQYLNIDVALYDDAKSTFGPFTSTRVVVQAT